VFPMGTFFTWLLGLVVLRGGVGYGVGVVVLPPLQPYLTVAVAIIVVMGLTGLLGRWVALRRFPIDAYMPADDFDSKDHLQVRAQMDACCSRAEFMGLLCFLTAPVSLPALLAFLLYHDCLFGRLGRCKSIQIAFFVFLALLSVAVGLLSTFLLSTCIVSLDDPCEGDPHLPTEFIITQKLLRVDKLTFGVEDLDGRPLGSREFQMKRIGRCGSPGAPIFHDQTMEYREGPAAVAVWADHRTRMGAKNRHLEQWDVYGCGNKLAYTIEEDLAWYEKERQDLWVIKDGEGNLLATAKRRELQSTEVQVYDYARTGVMLGTMKQFAVLQRVKTRMRVHIFDDSKVAPYVYSFLAMLAKLRIQLEE